jgi:hypothetical protein
MFENYETMTDAEKADVKAIHRALRAHASTRYGNLAWGFVRGFPYRRIERKTHTSVEADGTTTVHNRPDARWLTLHIADIVPGFAVVDPKNRWSAKPAQAIVDWLANEEGAIPAPVRVKKPFIRPGTEVEASAERAAE